jgi:hypothetical protein
MSRAPLAGLRVLTVSQFGAGPFGTQVLADLGADVIKIEDPTVGGDIARYVPPFRDARDSLYFQSFNRGKKSLTLDLRRPDATGVLHDLVRVSNAVYNNRVATFPRSSGSPTRRSAPSTRRSSVARSPDSAARAHAPPSQPTTTWSRATPATWPSPANLTGRPANAGCR